jgi:hypothetical protein
MILNTKRLFLLEAKQIHFNQQLTRYPQYTVLCSYRGYKTRSFFLSNIFFETLKF